jgi:hypothetical protein
VLRLQFLPFALRARLNRVLAGIVFHWLFGLLFARPLTGSASPDVD